MILSFLIGASAASFAVDASAESASSAFPMSS